MKKTRLFKFAATLCLMLTLAASSQAQDLKSILSTVASKVSDAVSSTTASSFSIVGTWTYSGLDCQFESDNLLAKAGGAVASNTVESKMEEVMEKLGFTDGCTYVFDDSGSYTTTVNGKSTSGTYTYDSDAGTLKLTSKLKVSFTCTVDISSSSKFSMLFDADKLMSLAKTATSLASSTSSSISTISSLLENYDGLQLGVVLEK